MLFPDLRGSLAFAAFALALAGSVAAAPADDLRDAQKLYAQGRTQPAMEKVDAYLKVQPREPQGRFLKGLLLTEQKKISEAIQVFTGLTEDFPELPEPYNNLAVLYASQGNYDKAKSALELAIHTHPSYATAHENLGDIYAQLASRAYDRALQLDKNNTTAQVKLAMVKELFVAQKPGMAAVPKPEAVKAAKPDPAKSDVTKPEPAGKVEIARVEPTRAGTGSTSPAAPASAGENEAVRSAIDAWAKAWSSKDVKAYLAAYAPDFEVPARQSRAAWEKQRAERIQRPKSIEVSVKIQSIAFSGAEATAVIRQSYKSDTLKSSSTKTLKLVKDGGKWLIKQERVGG
jgi:tetratricopeptide (TPR) repeat protein